MKRLIGGFAGAIALTLAQQCMAADFYGDAYSVSAANAPAGATSMRLSGPGRFIAEADSLTYDSNSAMPDGSYRYEIYGILSSRRLSTSVASTSASTSNDGRDGSSSTANARRALTGVVDSGHFRMANGEVFVPGNEVE